MQTGTNITHLLFANDSFLFFRVDLREYATVKVILNTYESALGQAVNFQKSGIFFSSNVLSDTRNLACDILGIDTPLDHGRYSSMFFFIGRSKKATFSYLKERAWQRICASKM